MEEMPSIHTGQSCTLGFCPQEAGYEYRWLWLRQPPLSTSSVCDMHTGSQTLVSTSSPIDTTHTKCVLNIKHAQRTFPLCVNSYSMHGFSSGNKYTMWSSTYALKALYMLKPCKYLNYFVVILCVHVWSGVEHSDLSIVRQSVCQFVQWKCWNLNITGLNDFFNGLVNNNMCTKRDKSSYITLCSFLLSVFYTSL